MEMGEIDMSLLEEKKVQGGKEMKLREENIIDRQDEKAQGEEKMSFGEETMMR
jgi:hypothetical protein